jgi:hypothetical protein
MHSVNQTAVDSIVIDKNQFKCIVCLLAIGKPALYPNVSRLQKHINGKPHKQHMSHQQLRDLDTNFVPVDAEPAVPDSAPMA